MDNDMFSEYETEVTNLLRRAVGVSLFCKFGLTVTMRGFQRWKSESRRGGSFDNLG